VSVSWLNYDLPDRGALFIVSGPSGAGKSTLIHGLVAELPFLSFSVSATTRAPRTGEVDGVHYHFVDDDRFSQLLEEGAFLEHAGVYGRRYGTPRRPIEEAVAAGRSVVLDIDVRGAAQVRTAMPEAVHLFVLPPDRKTALDRLQARGTDGPDVVARRMREMDEQLAELSSYDYLIVNDDLATARAVMLGVMLAELARRSRRDQLVDRWVRGG
jgi:guanylate kinase